MSSDSQMLQLRSNGLIPTSAMKAYCREMRIPEPSYIEIAVLDKENDHNLVPIKTMFACKLLPTSLGCPFTSGTMLLLTPKSNETDAVAELESIHGTFKNIWFVAMMENAVQPCLKRNQFAIGVVPVGRCTPTSSSNLPEALAQFLEDPFLAMGISPASAPICEVLASTLPPYDKKVESSPTTNIASSVSVPGEFCMLASSGSETPCNYHRRVEKDSPSTPCSTVSLVCQEFGRRKAVFDRTFELILSVYEADQCLSEYTAVPIKNSRLHDIFGMFLSGVSDFERVNCVLPYFERDHENLIAISSMQKEVQQIVDECHKKLATGRLQTIMSNRSVVRFLFPLLVNSAIH